MLKTSYLKCWLLTIASIFIFNSATIANDNNLTRKTDDKTASNNILSGNFIYDCLRGRETPSWKANYCSGFLHGFVGGLREERENPFEVCLPQKGPSPNAVYDSLREYLIEFPEERKHHSRSVVFNTLKNMYPCNIN